MSNQSQQYFSYLLRAWREREDSHWRFSLEGVNDKEQVYFASFRNLVAYLAALVQNPRRAIRHKQDSMQSATIHAELTTPNNSDQSPVGD